MGAFITVRLLILQNKSARPTVHIHKIYIVIMIIMIFIIICLFTQVKNYRVSQKNYPPLAGNRNETIRYYYSLSGQLNLSIFNLDSHTLRLKVVHQTPEIQACKVKFTVHLKPEVLRKGLAMICIMHIFQSTCKL